MFTSCFYYTQYREKIKHNQHPAIIFWHERVMTMFKGTVLCVPRSEAIRHAARCLHSLGISVTEKSAPDVTHLLLPVPSFSGGDQYLAHLLTGLPDGIIVSGGNLNSPLLEGYCCMDFLRDPYYLAENAAITADCAIDILENKLGSGLNNSQVLIVGWGRIGKCLMFQLQRLGLTVTVAARKSEDLAMIRALGTRSLPIGDVPEESERFDAIVNTVPVLVLPDISVKPDAVVLELASKPGITGPDIINARGLPGKMAPARSGNLIAETFIRLSL